MFHFRSGPDHLQKERREYWDGGIWVPLLRTLSETVTPEGKLLKHTTPSDISALLDPKGEV